MEAEVARLNAELFAQYAEIDNVLLSTLDVDDFVDLEALRREVQYPPFPREDLRAPLVPPIPIPDPPLPVQHQPDAPSGLFGKKKKIADAQAAADAQYAADYYAWQQATQELPARRAAQDQQFAAAEERRNNDLNRELSKHRAICERAERAVAEHNEQLDELITGLGYGSPEAVQEYVGIVLANSVYPDEFPVTHSASFEPATAELKLRVIIPGPDTIPNTKSFRYVKASDEIVASTLAQKDAKERYAGAVHNVALRSLHEVFEADRRGLIHAISLELGTETISPATGRETYVPFVAAGVSRAAFLELDLSAVTPSATLEHLNATVSKNPSTLTSISTTGVKRV
ncbi:conserved protein of unknown function [Agreia sp. COWG]|nr:conserved protein of unknown function [Agreia sp. COWG]